MFRLPVTIPAIAIALASANAANAESLPLGSAVAPAYSFGKTEAILGGGKSRLEMILAAQSAPRREALPVPASAGYGMTLRAAMPIVRPAIATDRPDVFGSVALKISRSPLDNRWHQVALGSPGVRAAAYAHSLAGLDPLQKIDAVNRYVNARITFTDDRAQFGVSDRWLSGNVSLRLGRGDCEDYAIAKLQMLRRAGFDADDLYFVILRDTRRRADHAVLVVRADDRLLVLDNGTDRIVDSDLLRDYRPIMTFAGDKVWTHGYRREVTAPVYYAAAEQPSGQTPAEASPETIALAANTLAVGLGALPF